MKPVFEKVPKRDWESFHCEIVRGRDYGTRWHFHPELQITLAIHSSGHRVVGDNIAPLTDGDIVLLGANLPHVWHQDENAGKDVHAIIARFDLSSVGGGGAAVSTLKLKGEELPVLPAASLWLALIALPAPWPMVVRLAAVRV